MRASRPHEKRKSPPLKSSKMSKAGGAAGRSRAGRLFSERRRVDAGGASRFLADPAGVRADVAADEEASRCSARSSEGGLILTPAHTSTDRLEP